MRTLSMLLLLLMFFTEVRAEQVELKFPATILIASQFEGVHERPNASFCGPYFLVVESAAQGCGPPTKETFIMFYVHHGEAVAPIVAPLSSFVMTLADVPEPLLGEGSGQEKVVILLSAEALEEATCLPSPEGGGASAPQEDESSPRFASYVIEEES